MHKVLIQHFSGEGSCLKLTYKTHKQCAKLHGYTYCIDEQTFANNYYAKTYLIRRELLNGAELVVFLDHDCLVINKEFDFLDYVHDVASIFAVKCELVKGDFNTGVLIVRKNDNRVFRLLDKWLSFSNEDLFYQDQGSFNIIEKYYTEFKSCISDLPQCLNTNNVDENTLVASWHGLGDKYKLIENFIKENNYGI